MRVLKPAQILITARACLLIDQMAANRYTKRLFCAAIVLSKPLMCESMSQVIIYRIKKYILTLMMSVSHMYDVTAMNIMI